MEDEEPNTPRRYSWKKLTQTAKSSRGFSPRFSFLHFSTVLCGIFSARLGVNLMEKYAPANKSFALFIFFFGFSLRIYELSIVFKVIQFFRGAWRTLPMSCVTVRRHSEPVSIERELEGCRLRPKSICHTYAKCDREILANTLAAWLFKLRASLSWPSVSDSAAVNQHPPIN